MKRLGGWLVWLPALTLWVVVFALVWWRWRRRRHVAGALVNPRYLKPDVRQRLAAEHGGLEIIVVDGHAAPESLAADFLIDATRHYPAD